MSTVFSFQLLNFPSSASPHHDMYSKILSTLYADEIVFGTVRDDNLWKFTNIVNTKAIFVHVFLFYQLKFVWPRFVASSNYAWNLMFLWVIQIHDVKMYSASDKLGVGPKWFSAKSEIVLFYELSRWLVFQERSLVYVHHSIEMDVCTFSYQPLASGSRNDIRFYVFQYLSPRHFFDLFWQFLVHRRFLVSHVVFIEVLHLHVRLS